MNLTEMLPADAPDVVLEQLMTLLTFGADNTILWANTRDGKRTMLASNSGPFFVAWTGRYKTNIFRLP